MQKFKVITPTQTTQVQQATQALQPMRGLTPTQSLKPTASFQKQRQAYQYKPREVETFLSNYNDPTELNSFIDALTNREAVSKEFGETWGTASTLSGTVAVLSFAGSIIASALAPFTGGASLAVAAPLAKIGAVATIPAIPAAAHVTVEKGIKPILAGKPKEAALNTLMNLGETADVLANPVKGLLLEGPEGFVKGTGLTSEGRINYDYNTGFFLTDMLLETISDPLNWVDLGTGIALKSSLKPIAETTANTITQSASNIVNKTFAKSIGEITTEGSERISKQMSKVISQVGQEWATKSFDKLTDAAKNKLLHDGRNRIQQALVQAIRKELPKASASEIDIILKLAGKKTATEQLTNHFMKEISDITFDTLSTDVIKGLAGIQHYSNTFQKFMTKGAMCSSGYGLGIEAVKNGWKGIKAWSNNLTLNRLKKATVFDNKNGLDIKQYAQAKQIWEASYKYTTDLTGEVTQRDMNSFYAFMSQQFNRDQQLISKILQDSNDPIKKAAQITDQFQALYNCDFNEYIGYLKGINNAENGLYTNYVKYLESINKTLNDQSFLKPQKAQTRTAKMLFSDVDIDTDNLIKNVQEAIKTSKNKTELADKFYTIKMNNAYVNMKLMSDPFISTTLDTIASDESIGALLDKITSDLNAYAPEIAPQIITAANTIKTAGKSFANITNFYNEIAGLPIGKIAQINDGDFKKYILDQVFNDGYKSVSELLAEFDDITFPAFKNGMETLLYDKDFKFADYPGLEDQITGAYRRFLETQQAAGIERLGSTVVQDFTKSIDDLIEYLPDYKDKLASLALANNNIKSILGDVKFKNYEMLTNVITDAKTIFGILGNTRQMTDAGLALKTVALKENLDMFNLSPDISGNIVADANNLGKAIKHTKEGLEQYHVLFKDEVAGQINEAYQAFYKVYISNPNAEDIGAFKYLKQVTDPIEQFTQLAEFNKLHKDKLSDKQYKLLLSKYVDSKTYRNIMNPSGLMVTDFAWDAMAESAWVAEKKFNESIINGITAYKNLGLASKKITNDFEAIRDILTTNKIDRPKMLQQERYIRVATKFNDLFDYLEKVYDNSFDKQLAQEEIESLRNVLINFPELNEKYTDLVDRLERYWRGELEFKQDPKYVIDTARLKGENYIDQFTPFWEKIKAMNNDIKRTLGIYNKSVDAKQAFKYNSITPWDPVKKQQNLNKLISKATDANAQGAFYNLFSLSPEEFVTELAYRRRFITFNESDINDYKLNKMFKKFNTVLPEGVHLIHDVRNHRYWYVLDKTQDLSMAGRQMYLNTNPIMRTQKNKTFNEFKLVDDAIADKSGINITETLNELDDALYTLTGSHLGDSQGEYLSKDSLRKLYAEQMPQEVRDLLPDFEVWTDKQFFDSYVFNESILGSSNSKRELGLFSSNQIINARNAITGAQGYLKAKNEYVNTVFDSMLSISSPNSVWSKFTNQDLLDALQVTPDYKIVTLVDSKKYGMQVREILPTSVEAIAKARELGAWIVPLQTYKDMYNVINHRLGSSGFAKLWSRIMYSYKFGYLCRPGAWIRNFIDTNLKSKLEMNDEFSSYKAQAHKILDEVDDIKNFIQARSKDGIITSDAIQEYFEKGYAKQLTYEQFLELNSDFLSQGISGNIMTDLYDAGGGDMWNTFTQLTGNIIEAGNKTENYNRLATYLYELDMGNDYTTALSKLSKIHFDYSFKSKAEQLVDLVFPFTTFSLRNYSYWIEMLEKHPWIMRNYVHLMKPSWDFKDYTPAELARDRRVQSQILYGQLKLAEFNNKVLTFKLNPSIQDAIQMFSDPINNVYEKLAAPIAYPISKITGDYTSPLNIIPMVGPAIQVAKTLVDNKPGISTSTIGVIPKRTQKTTNIKFTNRNYAGINTYKDKQYRVPTYRKNIVYDAYATKGVKHYRTNMYPIIDIYNSVKYSYSTNVYNRIKNQVKTDVYKGIRYSLRLDVNRWR